MLQAAHHLLRFAGAALHLPGPGGAQVFQHVLHLRQQFARLVARAAARHLAGAVEHALEVAAGDDLRRIGRLPRRIRIALHLLGERLKVAVERLAQLVHQPLDLGIGRVLRERILQLLLQAPQILLGQRHPAILDAQRGFPEDLLDAGDGGLVAALLQPELRQMQRQIDRRVVAIQHRARVQIADDLGHGGRGPGIFCQLPALVDDGAGDRVIEDPFGQGHRHRLALAGLAERIGCDNADLDRQPGPGMRRQIVITGRLRVFQMQPGERQFELDRLLRRRISRLVARAMNNRLDALHSVIVAGAIIEPQRGARGALRRLSEGDRRRVVRHDLDRPLAQCCAALGQ